MTFQPDSATLRSLKSGAGPASSPERHWLMGGSKLRAFGDPFSANVILPKQLLIETIESAVTTEAGCPSPGMASGIG